MHAAMLYSIVVVINQAFCRWQFLTLSGTSIEMTSIGSAMAPFKKSLKLKHVIKKLDVFIIVCLVAINEIIKRAFNVTIKGIIDKRATPTALSSVNTRSRYDSLFKQFAIWRSNEHAQKTSLENQQQLHGTISNRLFFSCFTLASCSWHQQGILYLQIDLTCSCSRTISNI